MTCSTYHATFGATFCVVKRARLVGGKTKLLCIFEEEAETTSTAGLGRVEKVAMYLLQLSCPCPL